MIPGEKVYIADNNNGERFETYIIKGERGSGSAAVGLEVRRLVRVSEGELSLGSLPPGRWRRLTPSKATETERIFSVSFIRNFTIEVLSR